jgi:hypothetical protein
LTWLPGVLRAAGLTVHLADGWRERGSSSWGPIEGITIHETRGSRTSTDAGEIRVLINGSNSAPPPIAQLYLSRSGEWWVVASGRCNHNLTGWAGPNKGLGNSRLLGIEAQHAAGEPWTARQYDSYVRGVAALVRHLGIPVGRVAGHKEHQPWPAPAGQTSTKSDPEFDMTRFRRDVTAALTREDDDMSAKAESEIHQVYAGMFFGGSSMGRTVDPDGTGKHPATNSVVGKLDYLLARVDEQKIRDEAVIAAVRDDADRDAILARIDQAAAALPKPPTAEENAEAVVRRLGEDSPDQAATSLIAVLGPDRAALLGAALVAATRDDAGTTPES